ncbi:MAG: hypothetical protein JO042_00590 [Sinobacteraceae bacterium]|nr:hypothetical protein [Nevskiaceae bacterium]
MTLALRTKVLIAAAIGIAAYVAFTLTQPTDTPDASVSRPYVKRLARGKHSSAAPVLSLLMHRVSNSDSARALFAAHSWYVAPPPPPPPPAPTLTPAQLAAMQKPTAPPLPFTYMGSYLTDGATAVFFLTQGDRVYDVRVGDTLENTYTVDSFTNGQLLMTYKPLNIQQQLTVGGSQ